MLAFSIGFLVVAVGALALAALTLQAARAERTAGREADRLRQQERLDLIALVREQANQLMYLANHPWETPPAQVNERKPPPTPRSQLFAGIGTLIDDDDEPSAFEDG